MTFRPSNLRAPVRKPLPLFRTGVAVRLAAALSLSGLLWIAILWAAS